MPIQNHVVTTFGNAPVLSRRLDPQAELVAQNALLTTAKGATETAKTSAAAVVTANTQLDIDQAAVAAAVATLVAEGASPTQANVTILNTAWGTLNTSLNAQQALTATASTNANTADTATDAVSLTAAIASVGAAVTLLYDPALIFNQNKLKLALDELFRQITGTNDLPVA